MTNHFNGLTEAEQERLSILIEECAEVIQAASKILRHGYASVNPLRPQWGTNRESLEKELGHVMQAVWRMQDSKDLDTAVVVKSVHVKADNIKPFLHHQDRP